MRISDWSSDVCSSDLGWSPELVAGRLAQEEGRRVISHETIYRFVYGQLRRTNDRRWRFYLPRAKYKRGWRTKGGWPRDADRPSIHDLPADIATRQQAGRHLGGRFHALLYPGDRKSVVWGKSVSVSVNLGCRRI